MLRYLTSGESHGKSMMAIIDGIPAGLEIDKSYIDSELIRRMSGYGRGKRMGIERDRVEIVSGVRKGRTIGSPVALMVQNRDYSIDSLPKIVSPRPGHADIAGLLKYGFSDIRDVLERSSARETVSRVAVGAIAKILLAEFGIKVFSHVVAIGDISSLARGLGLNQTFVVAEKSPVRCADANATKLMCQRIDKAADEGDTLGGIFEIAVLGCPAGLGSYTQWDRKLDGNIARALMSIQAVKGVSFGAGFGYARLKGSLAHDEIFYSKSKGFFRKTNNAGGMEGGMTNGEPVIIQAAMKPIATLMSPLASVNINTKKTGRASVQRSDVCAVPAAGVVGESVVAIEIANAVMEKFGCDSVKEMIRNYDGYLKQVLKT